MSKSENSELENFLTRWSSRKHANRTQSARQDAPAEHQPSDESGAVENRALAETGKDGDARDNQPFDPAQLPPLDSIGADTSIAAFLRRDVPPELTRAALRRAWTSDPAIKNFVGLVENGWDFNDPPAMSGFGPISAEEVARLAGKVIEALPAPEEQTKEVATREKKSQLAKTNALPTGALEAAPNTEEAGFGTDNDAAQQTRQATRAESEK
jgi:Protein of unknown function (DUF3306)